MLAHAIILRRIPLGDASGEKVDIALRTATADIT